MKKVRNVTLKEDTKIPVIMIILAVVMLVFSIVKIEFPSERPFGFSSMSSVLSVLPLTIGISAFMLIKTKKPAFCEFPCYIIGLFVALGFILLYFLNILKNLGFLGFAICILLIYPYIIAGLTARGCMYNKVFALGFAGLLLVLSVVAVIALTLLLGGFSCTYLILPLMYTELVLSTLCYDLSPIKKKKEEYDSIL